MADEPQTGAMIALIPANPEGWTVPGGEAAEDLHVTLRFFPDGADMPDTHRLMLHRSAVDLAASWPPFEAEAFSVDVFNPNGDNPCIVLGIGGNMLAGIRQSLEEDMVSVEEKRPWVAHMTLSYTGDYSNLDPYVAKLGPIQFTHVRVSIGEDYVDYPLNGDLTSAEPEEAVLVKMAASELTPVTDEMDAKAGHDDEEYDSEHASADCGCDDDEEVIMASVNTKSWQSLPIADRETPWSADEAITRISAWAGSDGSKFGRPFLWKAADGQPLNPDSYRLPIADVVNGKLTLIPRAVFSAGTILSGGHGYLEGVVSDDERTELKAVVTNMYDKLQEMYQDPRVVAPWLRGRTPGEREEEADNMSASIEDTILASVNRSGWSDMPIAEATRRWNEGAARARLKTWADGDMRKYRRGFLWWDESAPDNFGSYKLPIADIIDGTLTIVPRAVNSAYGATQGARGGVAIPSSDMAAVRSVLETIRGRLDNSSEDSATASAAPVAPPASWFDNPGLSGPTPLTVTADGRVFGHLAAWGVCHAGIANKCVMAPRSVTGYKYFRNGSVLTADGSMVKVGRLTVGTGHADPRYGYVPAADHYDNTGTAVAVVASGEDRYGIWVAGATVPDASPEKVAELRRSPLSGDWRRTPEGNLELVAALAVNTPGFPIVKFGADRMVASLVAAGMVLPEGVHAPDPAEYVPEPEMVMPSRLAALEDKINTILAKDRGRRISSVFDKFGG